jgi:prephenate dehydrogenase
MTLTDNCLLFPGRPIFDPKFTLKDARIAIVGLGLMGGSLGLALKKQAVCREVIGLVRRSEIMTTAEKAGVVDWATTDPGAALPEADIVVFAVPARTIIRQLGALVPFYKPEAIITDMGSTKQTIVQAMNDLPMGLQPLGSHPMCGKEQAGLAAAEANLFQGAPWILTPLARTASQATQIVQAMAEAIGCKTRLLEAKRHDLLVAAISHLPFVLATTLVSTAQRIAAADPAVWEVAAGGFRDTSRVAASDTTMWLDILLTNQAAITHLMDLARQQLDQIAQAVAQGDEPALRSLMEQAAQQRRSMYR